MYNQENSLKYIDIPLDFRDEEAIITVFMEHIEGGKATLLIDTGAQISIIRYEYITNKNVIDKYKKISIKGAIAGNKSTTMGIIKSNLKIQNIRYPHSFHVTNENISIGNWHGVLGNDFLLKYKCNVGSLITWVRVYSSP